MPPRPVLFRPDYELTLGDRPLQVVQVGSNLMRVINTCSDNASTVYQHEPPWPRAYSRPQDHEIGLSAYHYFQILVGDHTIYLGRVTVLYTVQHAGATHATSVVHVFRSINFCCDILPTPSENKQMAGATRHR